MGARLFWMHTDGGEPGDGAWYYVELNNDGEQIGEPIGPFESEAAARAEMADLGISVLSDPSTTPNRE